MGGPAHSLRSPAFRPCRVICASEIPRRPGRAIALVAYRRQSRKAFFLDGRATIWVRLEQYRCRHLVISKPTDFGDVPGFRKYTG